MQRGMRLDVSSLRAPDVLHQGVPIRGQVPNIPNRRRHIAHRPASCISATTQQLNLPLEGSDGALAGGEQLQGQTPPKMGANAPPCALPTITLTPDTAAYLEQLAQGTRHMLRDAHGRLSLKNFTRPQLEQWCTSIGESPKRALQVWRWMYADAGGWIRTLRDTVGCQGGLSTKFVDTAEAAVTCDGGLQLLEVVRSRDGTRKLVFKLTGGEAAGGTVETVLIPVVRSAGQRARITVCVSTQVGCAMNCQFCYTGRMGLLGNLTTAQIVEQLVEARRVMAAEGDLTPMTNMVFMGMGEPLHNPEAVADAIHIACCYLGLHMSHNKVTVSTVGLVPEIRRFAPRCRAQLAVSLHATTDEVRDWIVPINRRYPLHLLMATLRELYPLQPRQGAVGASGREAVGGQGDRTVTQADQASGSGGYVATTASAREARRRQRAVAGDGGAVYGEDGGDGTQETQSPQPNGTLLIAYTMLRGINDTEEDAHRLLQLLDGVAAKVNLIVFNPHVGTPFQPSHDADVLAFRAILVRGGRVCTIRSSRGDDEMAACGQLGDVGLAFRPPPLIDPPPRFRALLAMQAAEAVSQPTAC